MRIVFYVVLMSINIFLASSCNKSETINLTSIDGDMVEMNLYDTKKIFVIIDGKVCHDCIIQLNDKLISSKLNTEYNYIVLHSDPGSNMGRKMVHIDLSNEYKLNYKNIFFCYGDDKNIQTKLHIPNDIFEPPTPYIVVVTKEQEIRTISNKSIFLEGRSVSLEMLNEIITK